MGFTILSSFYDSFSSDVCISNECGEETPLEYPIVMLYKQYLLDNACFD